MRKITKESVNAFKDGFTYKSNNTKVEIRNGEYFFYLHDNMIASIQNNELFISTCGWFTNTTKERLNGILDSFNLPRIYQRNFEWFIDGEKFKGTKVFKLKKS